MDFLTLLATDFDTFYITVTAVVSVVFTVVLA